MDSPQMHIPDTRLMPAAAQRLARSPGIGATNFLEYAIEHNPHRDEPILWLSEALPFTTERATCLSLTSLAKLSQRVACAYARRGVRARDIVAVQTRHQVLNLIHYFGLTRLGAIPALINDRLPVDAAVQFVHFVEARFWARDEPRATSPSELAITELLDDAACDGSSLPRGRYHDSDPVLIAHSSGTTGRPKAVYFQNRALMFGPAWRVAAAGAVDRRILCALPLSHNAGVAFPAMALISGSPMFILNDLVGPGVLDAVEAFRPTKLVGFAQTFSDLAARPLAGRNLTSLRHFSSTGDAVHEAHIRRLLQALTDQGLPNGEFIDNLGSSELAFALFRKVYTTADECYGRRIGRPLPFVDAIAMNDEGEAAAIGEPGALAIRSPTLSGGYWNNSPLTFRSSRGGYWLTGDTVIQGDDGEFVHLDRQVDTIRHETGPVYTLPVEEQILLSSPNVLDCSVVAAPGRHGYEVPVAALVVRSGPGPNARDWLAQTNGWLRQSGRCELAGIWLAREPAAIPLGATGKVLKGLLKERLSTVLSGANAARSAELCVEVCPTP